MAAKGHRGARRLHGVVGCRAVDGAVSLGSAIRAARAGDRAHANDLSGPLSIARLVPEAIWTTIQRMKHLRWVLPLLFIAVTSAAPTLPPQGASAISAVLKA